MNKDHYLFTSESVSEGHPDKVADRIADAILDEFLKKDPESKVACEVFVSTGLVHIGGEVRSEAWVDVQSVAREVIREIGYNDAAYKFDAESCGIISTIHEQSPDINRGVVHTDSLEQGAGDQGMMFGYACDETEELMPLPLTLSHLTLKELASIRREGREMTYLRPDSKSQYTVEYDRNNRAQRIHTIVVSTQHDEFDTDRVMHDRIEADIRDILLPRVIAKVHPCRRHLFEHDYILHVNPTGKFVIGGPHGDTGLTGRKIIVDTYGGRGAHGGGSFSGKDPSKVDRSACYAARHIAKNLVAAGIAKEVLIQVAYAIGIARPVSIMVNTYGTGTAGLSDFELVRILPRVFDMRPAKIIERFGLKNPIYQATSNYGHFGHKPYVLNGMQFYGWEKTDCIEALKEAVRDYKKHSPNYGNGV